MRQNAPLDIRFGLIIEKKLADGGSTAEIMQKWGADAEGTVSLDEFKKYPLQLKSMGEFHPAGDIAEIKQELTEWFESLLDVIGPKGPPDDPRLDLKAAMVQFNRDLDAHKEKEEAIGAGPALEKAKGLQVSDHPTQDRPSTRAWSRAVPSLVPSRPRLTLAPPLALTLALTPTLALTLAFTSTPPR